MKNNNFKVWFSNSNYKPEYVKVRALNANDALILAQAERVKKGLDYTFYKMQLIKKKDK